MNVPNKPEIMASASFISFSKRLLPAMLVLFAIGTGAASAIACGDAINEPGATNTMAANSTANNASCFTVEAENITLNCQGFGITGDGGAGFVGILSNKPNTAITGCNVRNFDIGIKLSYSSNSMVNSTNVTESESGLGIYALWTTGAQLSSIKLSGNGSHPLYIESSTGINATDVFIQARGHYAPLMVYGSTDVWIRNITIANSTYGISYQRTTGGGVDSCTQAVGSYGLKLFDAPNFVMNNCWTNVSPEWSLGDAPGYYGAYYSQSYPTVIANSTFYAQNAGIALSEFALDTLLDNLSVFVSGNGGVIVGGDNSGVLRNSRVTAATDAFVNTGSENFVVANSHLTATANRAAYFEGSVQNLYANNTFESNGTVVVELSQYMLANTFINNTIKSKNATLLLIGGASNWGNLFYWNNFTNTNGTYVNSSQGNYWNTTIEMRPFPTTETSGLSLASTFLQTNDVGMKVQLMESGQNLAQVHRVGGDAEYAVLQDENHTDIANASFAGNTAIFSPQPPLSPGYYWIMTRSFAGDRTRHYSPFNSYPLAGSLLNWIVANNGGGEDPDNFIEIESITLQGNTYNGSEGNIWANVIKGSVLITGTNASGYGQNLSVGTGGSGYPYRQSTSQGKFICPAGCADYAPLTRFTAPPPQSCICGGLDAPNFTCMLEQDLRISGTCFKVTAPNIVLDCNGFSIIGDTSSEGDGVYSDQFNTTIKNCVIRDFNRGIYFEGAQGGTLSNLTVVANGRGAAAIYFSSSSNNALANIATFGNSGYAIFLADSSNNTLSNLTASANSCKYEAPDEAFSEGVEAPRPFTLKE